MKNKLTILKKFGFQEISPTVIQTLKKTHNQESKEKYRTKCFQSEEDRVKAYRAIFFKSRGKHKKSSDSI